ncbi:MAG: polyphenol oxidase family protein [Acidobacteriota bacterium]|nr:polyphenol oxidase family protein [Acidobacteriota bacterium]
MWSIETLESSALGRIAVPPFIPAGFSVFCTTLDFDGRLSEDRARLLTDFVRERSGIESALATCTQVHGVTAHRAIRDGSWRECDSCDALWADERNVSLAIKIADCLPVSMIDPTHAVTANIHSGWRGAAQGITAATLDAISRESAFDPAASFAYLGPSIRVCCFEVGEEVAAQFDARYIDRTHAKPHVDLVAFTTDILRAHGFDAGRISDSELCTRCDGSVFHSYRREGKGGGRNLQVVAM